LPDFIERRSTMKEMTTEAGTPESPRTESTSDSWLWIDAGPRAAAPPTDLLDAARDLGIGVESATDLPAVRESLARGAVDVILLRLDSWDLAARTVLDSLSAVAPGVPVLGVTDGWDPELADRWLAHGGQDLLTLDELDASSLERAIHMALGRERAVRKLAAREVRLARATEGAGDGLWDWDLATGEVYYSRRFKELLGCEGRETEGEGETDSTEMWLGRIHPDDRNGFDAALSQHLENGSDRLEHEQRLRTGNRGDAGSYRWFLARGRAVRDSTGEALRLAGSIRDVSARKQAEEQLLHDAFHDSLTGLPNRALFVDRLRQALHRRERRPEEAFAVLYFDLDRFKQVNDSLGHAVGDKLLVEIARRLRENLRPGDTVARLGGDEFGLLVHDVADGGGATHVANRVQEMLTRKYLVDRHEIFTSASIGIALATDSTEYRQPEEMLRDADLALYRAKAAGRGTYEVFDREMHRRAMALLRLETELRRAVAREDFVMYYQPIVSIESGRLVGFEALVRWRHGSRGLVPPREFLGVAEATGLIVPLGWWVLEKACRQMADWQQRYPVDPPLSVSANVSGKLFLDSGVVDRLAALLEDVELAPESLRLEITERVLLDHGDEVLRRLAETRALGVQLHLDDFGTGYSSLSHLQRFRYDSLKIDPSYVQQLDREEGSRALVRTLVALGEQLEMNVIAEGVETADQFQRLKELHCPEGQGHWIARPMDETSAEALIRRRYSTEAP
jgi:diguanylate cyclase (GGDEF)-like protein/PAS domain S-box-containing protein